MDRKNASDFPQELWALFDQFVHGEMDRRTFLLRAQKFAIAGSALALFESLRPNYAWAIQVPLTDPRIKTEEVTVPSPKGNGKINGHLARPSKAGELFKKAIHDASLDERIIKGWPANEAALEANKVNYTHHMYEGSQHGFHNDTTPRYDENAAKLAWTRTVDFLKKHLK